MMSFSNCVVDALRASKLLPVILCIGSDRVTGDCLGPVVGHLLINEFNVDAFVYGSLSSPVTALNLAATLEFIKSRHEGSPVIAVDSSLGKRDEVGFVRFLSDGLYPGKALGKLLPKAGDFAVTATVAECCEDNHMALSSVRLGFVYSLAHKIARTLSDAC